MNQKEVWKHLSDLLDKGVIYVKKVCKATPTSGAIYIHKDWIGKKVRVIIIPLESEVQKSDATEPSVKRAEWVPIPKEEKEQIDEEEFIQEEDRVTIDTTLTEMPE